MGRRLGNQIISRFSACHPQSGSGAKAAQKRAPAAKLTRPATFKVRSKVFSYGRSRTVAAGLSNTPSPTWA